MRRVDLERRARLAQEALGGRGVGRQVGLEQLDRDLAVHRQVVGPEHRAHAALAEHGVEPIATVEDDADEALREATSVDTRRDRARRPG